MDLFVYGTLMNRAQIEFLLKRRLGSSVKAFMPGFKTVISDRGYLAMTPSESSTVEGLVWRGLTDLDFVILDKYEGCDMRPPLYRREKQKAVVDDQEMSVWAYFGTPEYMTLGPDSSSRHCGRVD